MGAEKTDGKTRDAASKGSAKEGKEVLEQEKPRSLSIAKQGIKTSGDFANMMSALMSDLVEGKVTPNIANATCNAGGKLLKVVDMQQRYGTDMGGGKKHLALIVDPTQQLTA